MNSISWLFIHLQGFLVIFWLIIRIPIFSVSPVFAAVIILAVVFWPVGTVDLSGYMVPITGILSLTSMLLLLDHILRILNKKTWLHSVDHRFIKLFAVIFGIFLYPAALGLGSHDSYALGFTGPMLPLILGGIAVFAWHLAAETFAWLLVIVLWAWLFGLRESQNLWDYLLDPWLVIYAVISLTLPVAQHGDH